MKKIMTITTSVVILFLLAFSSCIKVNLKRNISPDYKENYAQFAASLYSPVQGNSIYILENESAVVSEEKIDQDASNIDLNFNGLMNENFLETSNKNKPSENPVSNVLSNDLNANDQGKFRRDVLSTINLKDSLNLVKTSQSSKSK